MKDNEYIAAYEERQAEARAAGAEIEMAILGIVIMVGGLVWWFV